MNDKQQLECFSGSQVGYQTQNMEETDMDNEAKSTACIQSHDKPTSGFTSNSDVDTKLPVKQQKPQKAVTSNILSRMKCKLRQLCESWQSEMYRKSKNSQLNKLKRQRGLIWWFWQQCRFWNPILGVGVAIVSLIKLLFY